MHTINSDIFICFNLGNLPPAEDYEGNAAYLFEDEGQLVEYKAENGSWRKQSRVQMYKDVSFPLSSSDREAIDQAVLSHAGEDSISSGDEVSLANAPDPPGDEVPSLDEGTVLAVYGSQALVDFGESGEHYVPKSWLSKTRTELARLVEDIWDHAEVIRDSQERVAFRLFGGKFKVLEDFGGVSVYEIGGTQSHGASRIIEESINYIYG